MNETNTSSPPPPPLPPLPTPHSPVPVFLKNSDAITRGLEYLQMVQRLALEPKMVDVMDNLRDRIPISIWVGKNIDRVNTHLSACLQACHECFHPLERPRVQIFAVPLAQSFGIDGLCNILTTPITILVDVGRVVPQHWLHVVAHEYAHAHLGMSGHSQDFASILSHLCLGLGLEPPLWKPGMEAILRSWPHCQSTQDPLAFWRGGRGDLGDLGDLGDKPEVFVIPARIAIADA